jgi:hypothetical protein
MTDMRSSTSDPELRWRWMSRTLLSVLGATALGTVIFMIDVEGGVSTFADEGAGAAVLWIAWNLAPIVAMAFAVLLTRRRLTRGVWVIATGVVGLVAFLVWAAFDYLTSDSSTAALVFLFGPVYLFLWVGVTLGTAAAVHALRGSRRTTEPRTAA